MNDVDRHIFTLRTFEGQEVEYGRRHDEIWPELVALQRRAGIFNFTLFQVGRDVVGYYEHDRDLAEIGLEEFEEEPLVTQWNEYLKDVIESFGEEPVEIWHAS